MNNKQLLRNKPEGALSVVNGNGIIYDKEYRSYADIKLIEDHSKLLRQVEKLQNYCNQFTSRSVNINHAMGVTGTNLLNSVFNIASELKSGDNDGI